MRNVVFVAMLLHTSAIFQSLMHHVGAFQLPTQPLVVHSSTSRSIISDVHRSKTRIQMKSPLIQEEDLNGGATDENDIIEVAEVEVVDSSSKLSAASSGITSIKSSRQLPTNWLGEKNYILFTSVLIGLFTGTNIAIFKSLVECVRELFYAFKASSFTFERTFLPLGDSLGSGGGGSDGLITKLPLFSPILWDDSGGGEEIRNFSLRLAELLPLWAIPVIGGIIVGGLLRLGDMPPGLRDTLKEVDLDSIRSSNATPPSDLVTCVGDVPIPSERNDFQRFSRKALASIATLGTGNSLGPEGPSVEAGMSLSRLLMNNEFFSKLTWIFGSLEDYEMSEVQRVNRRMSRERLLLACGAAAGVSAGFNAPLSGVFFALEIVQNALVPIDLPNLEEDNDTMQIMTSTVGGDALALQQINISAILLASVVSALTIQLLLGNELALRLGDFDFKNPLLELPLYLTLGAMAGLTAAIFSGTAQYFKSVFDGEEGPQFVQSTFQSIPNYAKPVMASMMVGFISIYVPQVLFFGYETLNGLFLNNGIPTEYLFVLLFAKLLATAISASSGLVGGTFAPSLFLGGVLGAIFHNVISDGLLSVSHTYPELAATYPSIFESISGLPVFAMVGAASVLASLFRAPLTASLLLFECTRNYDVILPLMASAGVASLTGDIVEKWLDEEQRESDPVSWGDLATRLPVEDDDGICNVPSDD